MKFKVFLFLAIGFSWCSQALALPEETGAIIYLQVHRHPDVAISGNQRFIVRLDSSISGGNNCSNDQWEGYLTDDAGKAQYSMLLALYISGKPAKIQGTNSDTCLGSGLLIRNVYPVSEN